MDIDLIIPWVDSTDKEWQKKKAEYSGKVIGDDALYRDWGLLRFCFRAVEKNLPWINRVHFVTCGHLPKWLNINHPKLNIVRHEDFIPKAFLPTFSSIPISLNIHRIPGLSDNFIYINDDFYFMGAAKEEEYFKEGLPTDYILLKPITESNYGKYGNIILNALNFINAEYDMHSCYELHKDKWESNAYTEEIKAGNADMLKMFKYFPGFRDDHVALSFQKKSFEETWGKYYTFLENICKRKFRSSDDVNDWFIRYRQLCNGEFTPYVQPGRKCLSVWEDESVLRDVILSTRTKVLCLNDSIGSGDMDRRREYLYELFEQVFPERSSYETD